jgi:hypothetical protein
MRAEPDDVETNGQAAISLLGRRSGTEFFLAFLVLITVFVPMIRLSRSGRIGLDLVFAFMLLSSAIATIRQKALT